ncbi:MAG: hypothetical protein GEU26_05520 [Nitrososphaeraceae archaeon]|nr:hypothetical protein [Nitrososphaeraceae archaeon]
MGPPTNDYKDTLDTEQNKLTAASRKQLHFYENKYAFISIDMSIIDKLHLTESDSFAQEITKDGILLRRQKEELTQ